jgi:DNA-directed RNA polymerase alpha subunit
MQSPERLLNEPITILGLSIRTVNSLEGAGVLTIRQLLNCCPKTEAQHLAGCGCSLGRPGFKPKCHLLDIPNFGAKTLAEVLEALAKVGFHATTNRTNTNQEAVT